MVRAALWVLASNAVWMVVLLSLTPRSRGPRFRDVMRRFNERLLDPATMNFAGRRHPYAAVIRHKGRRSGREYATPVVAVPAAGGAFVIPLPHGEGVEWLENVLAAGGAVIESKGETYVFSEPEVIGTEEASPLLDGRHRWAWRLFGIERCLKVKRNPGRPTKASASGHLDAPAFPLQRPSRPVRALFKAGARAYRGPLARIMGAYSMLLLTTKGRRSGLPRRTALTFQRLDGRYLVLAGMGTRSDWYRNLIALPRVEVRVGAHRFEATAEPVLDPQRRRMLAPGIAAQWDRFGPPHALRRLLRRWLRYDYDAELAYALVHAEALPMVELVPAADGTSDKSNESEKRYA